MFSKKLSNKAVLHSFLAMTLLLICAMANQIQAYSTEHATHVIENHVGQAGLEAISRKDFVQDDSDRASASIAADVSRADVDDSDLQPGELNARLNRSLENMNGNIDALITDMTSLQNEITRQVSGSATRTQVGALTDLIRRASLQKTSAEKSGTFQSYAAAEQEVIHLHATATRLAFATL